MAEQTVQDMTVAELEALIEKILDQKAYRFYRRQDTRTIAEILDSLDRNMWTPPPGSPSTLELLREDRDR